MSVARTGVGAVGVGVAGLAGALAGAWLTPAAGWVPWCMIAGCAALMAGSVLLGMVRSQVAPMVAWSVAGFLLVDIMVGFGLPLVLPAEHVAGPYLLGLPRRVAIEVYGVGLLPMLVLPVVFACTYRTDRGDAAPPPEC